MPDFPADIRDAVRQLYAAFEPYRVSFPLVACDHCVDASHQQQISCRPLDQLTPDDLAFYAFKAITTFGTIHDFKHFLPRIFELLARKSDFPVDPETVVGKLSFAEWRTWHRREQQAIERFLRAWWRHALESPDATPLSACLGAIARAIEDLTDFLAFWCDAMDRLAVARMRTAECICTELSLDGSDWPFWEEHPERRQQVLDWLRGEAIASRIARGMAEWFATPDGAPYRCGQEEYERWRIDTGGAS